MIEINLTGAFLVAQACAREMAKGARRQDRRHRLALRAAGHHGRAAYGSAKAGLELLTKVIAVELAQYGINVNTVAPGPIGPRWQVLARRGDARRLQLPHPDDRYGTPEEIAEHRVPVLRQSRYVQATRSTWRRLPVAGLMFPAARPPRRPDSIREDVSPPMPDLFSPFTLKGVTVRNRIAMSPMTMYRSIDGRMDDFHVMLMGSRAAGGFGLVFPEQIAITRMAAPAPAAPASRTTSRSRAWPGWPPSSRTWARCPPSSSAIPAARAASRSPGRARPSAARPPGRVAGARPVAIPFGGRYTYPVHALTVEEIKDIHRAYADAARRALAAGFEWLEMHFAHGYLGASFFSPLANQRTDGYGGSLENRLRFHREALDAVRAVWPERLPLTMRLGCDDFHEAGVQFDDAVRAVGI